MPLSPGNCPELIPIYKVSIIPREWRWVLRSSCPRKTGIIIRDLSDEQVECSLAGRVAEKIVFNDISSGAQNDLKEATSLAEKMVAQWGMSEKIGPVNLGRGEEHPFLGRELSQPKRYSEEMAWLMDQEIQKISSMRKQERLKYWPGKDIPWTLWRRH